MKKIILIMIMAFALQLSYGQNRKIVFVEKPWNDILAMSKEQKKLIFLDAFASWCGPCKWMAKNMFTNDTIADYYNQKFICVSMDMEKGEGLELAKKFQIKVYPTLLFIDSDGSVLHRKAGAAQKVQDYIDLGNIAMDPAKRMSAIEKKYRDGDRSTDLVLQYMKQLAEAYIPLNKVLDDYFSTLNPEDYTSRASWTVINNYISSPDAPPFQYLLKHQAEFAKLYTEDSVDMKISSVYENSLMQIVRSGRMSDSTYIKAKETVLSSGFKGADKVIFNSDLMYYQMKQRKDLFLELTYKDLDKFYSNDAEMLNNIAWSYSGITNDAKYLAKALQWSMKSNKLAENPSYLDTYATLLLKTGNKDEAIKQQKAAVALAKKKGVSAEQYETKLNEMLK